MTRLSLPNVLSSLKELLVVWIYQILFYNNIYPLEVFTKALSFDLIVYISRNPSLTEYIETLVVDFLDTLTTEGPVASIEDGHVKQLSVLLYDVHTNKDQERYILKFELFINLKDEIKTPIRTLLKDLESTSHPIINLPGFSWEEIYSQFKSFLFHQQLELQRKSSKQERQSLPQDLFFKVMIDVANDGLSLSTSKEWVRAQPVSSTNVPKTKFVPIAEVEVGFLCFGLQNEYVRERQ